VIGALLLPSSGPWKRLLNEIHTYIPSLLYIRAESVQCVVSEEGVEYSIELSGVPSWYETNENRWLLGMMAYESVNSGRKLASFRLMQER